MSDLEFLIRHQNTPKVFIFKQIGKEDFKAIGTQSEAGTFAASHVGMGCEFTDEVIQNPPQYPLISEL